MKFDSPTDTTASEPSTSKSAKDTPALLAKFKNPDGKPKYPMMGEKPVITIEAKTVLTVASIKFHDKLLCDGLTLNTGDTCVFSCTFCYAHEAMLKLRKARLIEFNRETGLSLGLDQVVIRRGQSLEILKFQLLHSDGSRIYDDPADRRVVYSSTLVDVAANMELLRETAAACILILENTEWQIRLLSKSPLLKLLVTKKMIPEKYHYRLILGFSTGTLDDKLAAAIEQGTGKVSMRIKALHELQDLGIRTFGMICPSLPSETQEDYDEFSRRMCKALRIEQCEHVWAEVINVRGDSLKATVAALQDAGYADEASRLAAVSGPGAKAKWEDYARMTFHAHKKHVPADKLRFLQYVDSTTATQWSGERPHGAVLLGKYAEANGLLTIETSAETAPFPDLEEKDVRYREEREEVVTRAIKSSVAASKALYEIKTYQNGILWRKNFRTFEEYCENRWDYQRSHAYRLLRAGAFFAQLEASDSPFGENYRVRESHLRWLVDKVPEELQPECWATMSGTLPEKRTLIGKFIKAKVQTFLADKGIVSKPPKRPKRNGYAAAKASLKRLEADLAKFLPGDRFIELLEPILRIIESGNSDGGDVSISLEAQESGNPSPRD